MYRSILADIAGHGALISHCLKLRYGVVPVSLVQLIAVITATCATRPAQGVLKTLSVCATTLPTGFVACQNPLHVTSVVGA